MREKKHVQRKTARERERGRGREISFKKLAHMIIEASKYKIYWGGREAGDPEKS